MPRREPGLHLYFRLLPKTSYAKSRALLNANILQNKMTSRNCRQSIHLDSERLLRYIVLTSVDEDVDRDFHLLNGNPFTRTAMVKVVVSTASGNQGEGSSIPLAS